MCNPAGAMHLTLQSELWYHFTSTHSAAEGIEKFAAMYLDAIAHARPVQPIAKFPDLFIPNRHAGHSGAMHLALQSDPQ